MVGPQRPQFVLFGSSIVQYSFSHQGWGSILSHLYARKADILLRGYAGWNSRLAAEVLDQVFPKDAIVQPSLVIVYFGGNDSMRVAGPHVPLPEYIDNMKKIASHLKSLSDKTRIIFLTSPPVNEKQFQPTLSVLEDLGRTNEECGKYAEACVELCKEIDVKVIDLWTALQQTDDWRTSYFTDGIHLTSKASEILVKEILKVVKEAEWEPDLHWKSLPIEFPIDYNFKVDGKTINVSDLDLYETDQW